MRARTVAVVAALLAASVAAAAGAAPRFLRDADSTTITGILPPHTQGSACCPSCAGNDACPDCTAWATSMGMLLGFWDDYDHGGGGPWERLLPGGDADDPAAYRAVTQALFDRFGGDSCEGSSSGLFFWFFCAEDRGLLEGYTSDLGYSFAFYDHDWLDWSEDVVTEINGWRPVYYGYYPEGGGNHVVLVIGYDDADRTMRLYNTWDYAVHVKGFDEAFNHCAVTSVPGGADCSAGPCCSALGAFRPPEYACDVDIEREVGCPWGRACGQDLAVRTRDRMCPGESADCDGALAPWKPWEVLLDCGDTETCTATEERCVGGAVCGCDCAEGECCDGCRFLPADTPCGEGTVVQERCTSARCGATIERREGPKRCTGMSGECTEDNVGWSGWTASETCAPTAGCVLVADGAGCRECEWGCDEAGCLPCPPDCDGRQCGDDRCGGSCGDCPLQHECTADGRCEYQAPPGIAGGSGCDCRAAGGSPTGLLALLVAVVLAGRRRQRRRS
ncbi:MAG: hypothetical protein HY905_22185 [Deltaproteobacteria bacterium]|nr:hypothetical protein [Deltaproteobacteria bacterium]